MQLGKAKKGANDFLDSLRAEGELVDTNNGFAKDNGKPAATGQPVVKAALDPLFIAAEEKVRAVISNNGGVEELEVNGTISLQVPSCLPVSSRVLHFALTMKRGLRSKQEAQLPAKKNMQGLFYCRYTQKTQLV